MRSSRRQMRRFKMGCLEPVLEEAAPQLFD